MKKLLMFILVILFFKSPCFSADIGEITISTDKPQNWRLEKELTGDYKTIFADDFYDLNLKWWNAAGWFPEAKKVRAFHGILEWPSGDYAKKRFYATAGDSDWKNITLEAEAGVAGEQVGSLSLCVRFQDPGNGYELRYITGAEDGEDGLGKITRSPALWVVKWFKGKALKLGEYQGELPLPDISGSGNYAGEFIKFKFEAAGDVLKASIDDGNGYKEYIRVTDSDIKTGKIALGQIHYNPQFADLKVTVGGVKFPQAHFVLLNKIWTDKLETTLILVSPKKMNYRIDSWIEYLENSKTQIKKLAGLSRKIRADKGINQYTLSFENKQASNGVYRFWIKVQDEKGILVKEAYCTP